jgi:hypothetical protein
MLDAAVHTVDCLFSGKTLRSGTIHIRSIRKHLALHLLILGVFNQSLVLACTALANAAKCEDDDGQEKDTAHDTCDDVLGGLRKAIPFLGHALGCRGAVVAVE